MSFQITSRTYNLYLNLGIQYLKVYSEYLSTSLHGQLIFNIVSNQELQIFHFGSKFTLKIGGDLNKISNEASILLLSPQGDIILDYPFDKIGNINQTKTINDFAPDLTAQIFSSSMSYLNSLTQPIFF